MKKEEEKEKEELLTEIERLKKELKKKKKYGLVWEEKPEEVVEMCKKKLPVLKEVKAKEIITDKEKPINLLIEGDNYHALSVLNYTHKGKIDVIYIDPPYNTGNKDFIFNDRYIDREDSYRHSKWISFMHKRLKLAKSLLKESGVIFVSIDDNEIAQLKLLCDEIFGPSNFISTLTWTKKEKASGVPPTTMVLPTFEYIIVYSKNKEKFSFKGQDRSMNSYKIDENNRYWRKMPLQATGNQNNYFNIIDTKTSKKYYGNWAFSEKKIQEMIRQGKISFPEKENQKPTQIVYADEMMNDKSALFSNLGKFDSEIATKQFKMIFDNKKVFDFPKPLNLIEFIINQITNKNSTILDFMAGSGTTGHAVLDLNREDGGNRKFILCTNNENNIATDVCYPRIKKVIKGYKNLKNEDVKGLGGNLKYFKTDFVDYKESTDRNKIKLTKEAVEILCIKEDTFELVEDKKDFKIFKNNNHYTGIIFNQLAIEDFKKAIKDIKDKISVYVFSLGDDSFEDEFEDIKTNVKLSPIPEAILKVYRRIFK